MKVGTKKVLARCFRHLPRKTTLTGRSQKSIVSATRKWLILVEFAGFLSDLGSKKTFSQSRPSSLVPQSHPVRPSPMKKITGSLAPFSGLQVLPTLKIHSPETAMNPCASVKPFHFIPLMIFSRHNPCYSGNSFMNFGCEQFSGCSSVIALERPPLHSQEAQAGSRAPAPSLQSQIINNYNGNGIDISGLFACFYIG